MLFTILIILIKETKYCSDEMKKHSIKNLVMTKKDNEDFENPY